jgi:hypothetical protein
VVPYIYIYIRFSNTTLLYFHKHSLHMVFPFRNPKHLHTKAKEDYFTAGILIMTSFILQGGLLNTTKKEGVLS